MREEISLDGLWNFFKAADCFNALDSVKPVPVSVPHTWNALDGQDGGNDYFRGTCCYLKTLPEIAFEKGQQVYIEFKGVNSSAKVYLNGQFLVSHDGGYSSFTARIDPLLTEENELAVFVDNSVNDRVYPQHADFTFYGGIYREVRLITVCESHFTFGEHGGKGVRLTPSVEGKNGVLRACASVSGKSGDVRFSVYNGTEPVAEANGSDVEILIPDVHLWDGINDPFLYTVKAEIYKDGTPVDCLEYEIGFRTFEFNAREGFFLNGKSYPLRGVSRHQDREGVGNALTKEMHEEDLKLILETGANSIRLAHYQHDGYFYDLCDRAGIVCWAEIPYITKHMDGGRENTLCQLRDLIEQCCNHTCIACWGISNEITAGGNTESNYENNRELYELCHELDYTRPVAMAHAFMLPLSDRMVSLPDIAGYNLYYGWYLGEMGTNGRFLDSCHEMYPDLPLGLTEFGCDANLRFQTSEPKRGDYSEQYQALFHEFMCSEIDKRPYLWGTYIWNMFDFGADARDEGGTKGRNCKGLVTFDRKVRKDSFYAVKAWYSKEPFVHICGKRYVNRCGDETVVKVYSNTDCVELLCNGTSLGKISGSKVFEFRVALSKENKIVAKAGNLTDSVLIKKADEEDLSYKFTSGAEVSNWFEGLELVSEEGFLSVHDCVGTIMDYPQGCAIVVEVMKKREENSFEGVASQVILTEEVMRMTMKDIPLLEILRKAKAGAEYVRSVNDRLCKIRK